jgi:hypothetical protein
MLTILSDREAHQLASYVTEMNTALSNIMVIIAAAQTVQVDDKPVHKPAVLAAGTSATKTKTKAIKHRKTRNTLNEKKVLEIKRRLAQGEKAGSICRDFRVHVTTINSIKYGKTWQHVQLHQAAAA